MKRNFELATLRFHGKETALNCALLLVARGICGLCRPELEETTGLYKLVEEV